MHKKLIEEATHEQLKDFVMDAMSMLKETNPDTYETLETYLYKDIYGCHFNDWMLKKATDRMMNEDGTKGGHWSLEETDSVAKQYNINMANFNRYDWNYVLNMIYSDYYGAIPNDLSMYVKLATKFLNDKDGKSGKALNYYLKIASD